MESLKHKYVEVNSAKEALEKMRFHHFDLIIFCDGFDNLNIPKNPVLDYLNGLSMSIRRRIFLTLIGSKLKSMDDMLAYSLSANLVVNFKDVKKMQVLLTKTMTEHKRFYKVFMDTLKEIGKI